MDNILGLQIVVALAKCAFSVAFVMNIVPILIWGERKVSAFIQDRPGPNRAHVMGIRAAGLVHTLNDVVKLIMKEDVVPDHVEKSFWFVAPIIAMSVSLCTFAVVPWGDHLVIPKDWVNTLLDGVNAAGHALSLDWHARIAQDLSVKLQVADINGGLLYVLAITSLGVYGIMLAGWASNNKFSLLGGLRSSAQMVSYELAMGLSVVVMFLVYGTPRLSEMVVDQSGPIWNWGVFRGLGVGMPVGLLAFILFWTSVFAETNRLPFDMPEGEAELVAGYHLEYSSLRFALFFMAEYANMIVGSAVTATLFFGGYSVPFLTGADIRHNADLIVMALGVLGVLTGPVLAMIAWRRRNVLFYKALPANDIRHREPRFWVAVWLGYALAHAGLAFLGAQHLVSSVAIGPELLAFLLQVTMLGGKILIGTFVMIWIRWTLPRFRYDQVMNLGWRYLLPLALANVMLAGVWVTITHVA